MENRNCPNCGAPAKGEKCEYCGALIPVPVPIVSTPAASSSYAQAGQAEELSLWGYYIKCLKNYVNFRGRARRKEYWGFGLFNFIIAFAATFFGMMLFGEEDGEALGNLYALAVFIPGFAVLTRRLHDIGKSGWSWLWVFTIIGIIPVVIWLWTDSQYGENEYGPCPK